MSDAVDISEVPFDLDPLVSATVKNPSKEDVTVTWNKKMLVVPAEGEKVIQLPIAVHIAKHIAQAQVLSEHERFIKAIKDEKKRESEIEKPIARYQERVLEIIKEIMTVEEEGFFEKEGISEILTR